MLPTELLGTPADRLDVRLCLIRHYVELAQAQMGGLDAVIPDLEWTKCMVKVNTGLRFIDAELRKGERIAEKSKGLVNQFGMV